jgi:hypothetical protein
MEKGDRVVATRHIGGMFSESVPKGADGAVTQVSRNGLPEKVLFVIPGGMFNSDRRVEVRVTKDDVF